MPKPLSLFIRPPYTGTADQTWTRVRSYGLEPQATPPFQPYATFRTQGTGTVLAACDGLLTVGASGWRTDPREPIADSAVEAAPTRDRLRLHISLSPATTFTAAFDAASLAIHTLSGFTYFEIERATLQATLGSLLQGLTFADNPVTPARAFTLFLAGELSIPVRARDPIGRAAPSLATAPPGSRDIGFAATTDEGLRDPSFVYDSMRTFVEDTEAEVSSFIALSPVRWPVVPVANQTDIAQGVANSQTTLLPWPVLQQFIRDSRPFTSAEHEVRARVREIGRNQKNIYRERLLVRAGRAPWSSALPFDFDDLDWRNVFQLEAIVEFYANFEPWLATSNPVAPTDPNYIRVNFLDPAGDFATVSSRNVTLQPDPNSPLPDLSFIQRGDTIRLEADTARASRTYSIQSITGNTVTLDATPTVAGNTAWKINPRPTIVMIDPFGARERSGQRLEGNAASVVESEAVELDGTVSLERINRRRVLPNPIPAGTANRHLWESGPFDTIYFPDDIAPAAPGRAARTYRITAVEGRRVWLDGQPNFGQGLSSRWHIPAGLSGELPPLAYNIGPHREDINSSHGTDHYDGAVFLIDNGTVTNQTRLTSFTSRRGAQSESDSSSIRPGLFRVSSLRAGKKKFINYAFLVQDFRTADVGDARRYFTETVEVAPRKTGVMIHNGNINADTGSGSGGCLVGPCFYQFRNYLIERHLRDFRAVNAAGTPDPPYAIFQGLGAACSEKIFSLTDGVQPPPTPLLGCPLQPFPAEDWNNKLNAILWLVRPDERPLSE